MTLSAIDKQRIAELEQSCPLLSAFEPSGWRDFRDDSTEWRGGIFIKDSDRNKMKALFGSKENADRAAEQLKCIGLSPEVEKHELNDKIWSVFFDFGDQQC